MFGIWLRVVDNGEHLSVFEAKKVSRFVDTSDCHCYLALRQNWPSADERMITLVPSILCIMVKSKPAPLLT